MSSYLLLCCIYFDAWCITCCPKREETLGVYTVIVYLLYLLRCLVYHMLFKTRRNSGSLHRVIGEVLVLGLLVVVHKIPYSSCIFNTAVVVLEPTMVCAYHTAVYLVHRSCLCHTPEYLPWYICSTGYAELPVVFCCICLMLGVSHAVQNEKKL